MKQCSWCDQTATVKLTEQMGVRTERPWIDYACDEHSRMYGDGYDRSGVAQ